MQEHSVSCIVNNIDISARKGCHFLNRGNDVLTAVHQLGRNVRQGAWDGESGEKIKAALQPYYIVVYGPKIERFKSCAEISVCLFVAKKAFAVEALEKIFRVQ
jgi:hypothetical protein